MCRACYSIPDRPDTQMFVEPDHVYICKYCGNGIIEDDEYAKIGDDYYHVDCLSNEMNVYELLNLFDVDVRKAVAE